MTDDHDPNAALEFDRADFESSEPSELRCQSCQRAIEDQYYTAGQAVVCEVCRHGLEVELGRSAGGVTIVKAIAFGVAAAAAGAVLWAVVVEITGYEIGLIAIAVGFMVGGAIRAATRRRGGALYQVMAVLLTYLSIVSTYVPAIVAEVDSGLRTAAEESGEPATAPPVVTGDEWVVRAVTIAFVAILVPFLGGFDNIIGLLIIGFALWQAWSMNRRLEVVFAGPFRAGDASAGAGS